MATAVQSQPTKSDWLTVQQFCERINIKPDAGWKALREGTFEYPHVRIGKQVRIHESVLDQFTAGKK